MWLTDRIFSSDDAAEKFPAEAFDARHDLASIKTYRYLRLGMLTAVAALSYSILEEREAQGVHCFLGSISGYYYTPVHPVFIGVMVAIGVALIVIKGSTVVEDVFLSLAGVMAPIVAFVPTSDATGDSCRKAMFIAGHYLRPSTDGRNAANSIDNDLHAYLVAGTVAIGLLFLAAFAQWRRSKRPGSSTNMKEYTKGTWWSLAGALVLVGIGWALVEADYSWVLQGHGKAAVAMFVFLAGAALTNGILGLLKRYRYTKIGYALTYVIVGAAMLVFGALFVAYQVIDRSAFHGHLVLVIEIVELGLFATFWALQTVERWNKTV